MSTLYEITGDYLRLLEMLEEEESLDPQAFKDTLEGIEESLRLRLITMPESSRNFGQNQRSMLRKLDGCRKGWRRLRTMRSG